MARRDCPIVLNRCGGQDSPITNTSSEDPDPVLFAGIGWTQFDPWEIPPIGDGKRQKVDCSTIVWSSISQFTANFLAIIAAAGCQPPPPPPPPPVPPIPPLPVFPPFPTSGPQVQACNDEQTITVTCTDGTIQTFVIPAGTVCETLFASQVSQWKAFINDWLVRWYTIQAQLNCPGTPDEVVTCSNDRQEASVQCPDGSVFTAAIEAGTVTSPPIPQSLCVAWKEYVNATLLAQLLQGIYDQRVCPEIPNLNRRTPPGIPPGPPALHPRLSSYPGWCCLGSTLDSSLNTYNITGGGSESWSFSISGQVPPGTSLVETGPMSAELVGSPTVAGNYNYTITATNGSNTITINDTLNVFGLVNDTLPGGTEGLAYSETLVASGGMANYTFSGIAPAGLALHSDGTIDGTPTSSGTFSFTVTITDSQGAHCDQTVHISIASAGGCPNWSSLAWGAATLSGPGTQNFVPNPGTGNTCTASFTTPDDGPTTIARNTGSQSYLNLASCNCNAHLTLVSHGVDVKLFASAFVQVWLGGVLVNAIDVGSQPDGPYDLPFTLPPTPISKLLEIRVGVTTSFGLGNYEDETLQVVLTNI